MQNSCRKSVCRIVGGVQMRPVEPVMLILLLQKLLGAMGCLVGEVTQSRCKAVDLARFVIGLH